LAANGSADYPLDDYQWSGGTAWSVTHESDQRRFQIIVSSPIDSQGLKQRFSLAGFDQTLIQSGGLELNIQHKDFTESSDVGMNSRWTVKFYNALGGLITPATSPIQDTLTNTWQTKNRYVTVPAGAVEVLVEYQVVMDFDCKGANATKDVCSSGADVYVDDINIAAVEKNRRAAIKPEADHYRHTLYSYSVMPLTETITYFSFDANERSHYQLSDQGVVSEVLYDLAGQVSDRITYGTNVKTDLDAWLVLDTGESAPSDAQVATWLGVSPVISEHIRYHTLLTLTLGNDIDFSDIIEVVAGTSDLSIESIVNEIGGTVTVDYNAETITFTPSGPVTGNERFDVILSGEIETLRIELTIE